MLSTKVLRSSSSPSHEVVTCSRMAQIFPQPTGQTVGTIYPVLEDLTTPPQSLPRIKVDPCSEMAQSYSGPAGQDVGEVKCYEVYMK